MRIGRIIIRGFRALKNFPQNGYLKIGSNHSFIGKNDSGKSSILYALQAFFKEKPKFNDLYLHEQNLKTFEIEIGFIDLPEVIQLEPDVDTTFMEERLLDADGYLTLIKEIQPATGRKKAIINTYIKVSDYDNEDYQVLCEKKEKELIDIGQSLSVDLPKSGAGKTNKERRSKIREILDNKNETKSEKKLPIEDIYKKLSSYLPTFILFPADQSLSEDTTPFKNQFKPITKLLLEKKQGDITDLEKYITDGLAVEFDKICMNLSKHTGKIKEIKPTTSFDLQKGIDFTLDAIDELGTSTPLANRGAGIRRLFMVAYFQYLTERDIKDDSNYIFAIEEPEVFLHPGAQRELLDSLFTLSEQGNQVLFTTHSPVFAGRIHPESLSLIHMPERDSLVKLLSDYSNPLEFAKFIADDIGVEASDSLAISKGIIFVEGIDDIDYLSAWDRILKDAGEFDSTLESRQFHFIIMGGQDNLKHWIDRSMLSQLGRNYAVIIDCDKKSENDNLKKRIKQWKETCEDEGAYFHIWNLAEIECYLSPSTIDRIEGKECNVSIPMYRGNSNKKTKKTINQNIQKAGLTRSIFDYVKEMNPEEIMERSKIKTGEEKEKYEIIEVLNCIRNHFGK